MFKISQISLRTLFTLAVPAALLGLGAMWLLDPGSRATKAVTYDTQVASKGAIRRIVASSGPVRALVTVSVGSQLSGQIAKLNADFNSEVKEGDELAVLDDKTYVARVNAAKADLAAAEATLANQRAALQKAEAVLRQAERVAVRQQTLQGKGISSTAALDTATRDLDTSRADVAVATAQIANGKATIQQKQAALEQSTIDLERTRIRSPINGVVISRTMDIGQTVAASLQAPELFKIAQDLRSIRIEAQVNEADVGQIADGNPVNFTVDAYPEQRFTGKVVQVRLAATEINSVVTYTVMIEAKNEERRLYPGMTATVQIETDMRDGVLRAPNEALRFRPRDRQAPGQEVRGKGDGAMSAERALEQTVSQLTDRLALSPQQASALKTELDEARRRAQAQRGQQKEAPAPKGPKGPSAGGEGAENVNFRTRFLQRVEQALEPILTAEQRPAFDRWKRGRDNTRPAVVWVVKSDGDIEGRNIRAGIADDRFTEITGGQLREGEAVVTRAREAKK